MSNSYSIDDLRNDLDAANPSLDLDLGDEKITLVNVMRLKADVRKRVMADFKEVVKLFDDDDADPVAIDEAVNKVLGAVVADDKGQFLRDIISGDTALAMRIFDLWMRVTQAGEASNSSD